jgi:hypothetical protein
MKEKYYRGFCQRQHKILGFYLANLAWKNGVDCIVLSGTELKAFLDLEKIKQDSRLESFIKDIKPWFPYHETHVKGNRESLASIFLSRHALNGFIPTGTMSDEERIEKMMAAGGPKSILFWCIHKKSICERDVVNDLALLASGLETQHEIEVKEKSELIYRGY